MKTDNKLIAEFMAGRPVETHHNQYHTSWNELMPVVEKIEENHFTKIVGKHCSINQAKTSEFNNWIATVGMTFAPCKTKIEAVYKAVVIFIKWYNEQNT